MHKKLIVKKKKKNYKVSICVGCLVLIEETNLRFSSNVVFCKELRADENPKKKLKK